MKCLTDSAIELTWPGVPVTACASMRPVRSKMPADRSPASRTIERERRAQQRLRLLLDHGDQPVPHDLQVDVADGACALAGSSARSFDRAVSTRASPASTATSKLGET